MKLSRDGRDNLLVALAVAVATFLPFLPLLAGRELFFRDLALYFFPLRRFVAEGLRAGEARWWNAFVHEGEPLALPAIGYPFDLLHALWPHARFFSLLLALHLPLGACGLFLLARRLGCGRAAAAAGALAYGLGGFALSAVNLYVYCQALGWAPWAVLGLVRASAEGPRAWWRGAVPVALCASSTGVEVMAQAFLAAPLLVDGARRRLRMAAIAAVGLLLSAAPLMVLGGAVANSVRAQGFGTDVVLGHSVHPLTLAQTLVAGFYGDTARIAERWWGQNFFPLGFPYVLSLYLGASVIALAAAGALRGGAIGRRLAVLAALALLVCLGRWAGWAAVVDRLALLRVLRYPSKAFFTVHLAAALLAALGLDALAREPARAGRVLAVAAGALGALLAAMPLLPSVAPRAAVWFAAGFFPPDLPWPQRAADLRFMLSDAATGGALALLVAVVAAAAAFGRLRPQAAAAAAACIVGVDLLRAGAGLNPTLPDGAARPSAEALALAGALQASGARVFSCDVATSPAYLAARAARGGRHVAWSASAIADTLTPAVNVPLAVPSAYSADLTMLVPQDRVPRAGEGCAQMAGLVPRLSEAAVGHVLSLDPLAGPALSLEAVIQPPRLQPLRVFAYRLAGSRPRFELRLADGQEVPGAVRAGDPDGRRLEVDAPAPGRLLVRDAMAAGVSARVDGRPARIETVEGRYRAVAVPKGRSEVRFSYTPPRLALGVALSAMGALVLAGAWAAPRISGRRSPSAAAPAAGP